MHFPLTVEIRTVLVSPVSPGGNHTPVSPWRPYVQRGFGLSATGGSHAEALLPCTRRQLSVKADSACGGKPHPSTHLLICCTGITPYNVIIHPDPGFVKCFLKFKHNIPAHRVGRELAGGKLLFIGYMLIYSFPQTKRRTAPGSPPFKISYNLLRSARNRTAYYRSIIYNAGHTYSRQRKRYMLSLGLRLNAGDNDRRYR